MKFSIHRLHMFTKKNSMAITVVFALILLSVFVFIKAYPFKTVEVKSIRMNEQTVVSGTEVTYSVDQCRFYNGRSDVDRLLVDISKPEPQNLNIGLNSSRGIEREAGCYKFDSQRIFIPAGTPTGLYKINFRVTHYLFRGLRTIQTDVESNVFAVISPADQGNPEIQQNLEKQVQKFIKENPAKQVEGYNPAPSSPTPANPPLPTEEEPVPEEPDPNLEACIKAGQLLQTCLSL